MTEIEESATRKRLFRLFDVSQVFPAVDSGPMAVAELEGDGIVADTAHSGDDDPGEPTRPVTTPTLSEDVDFAHVLGARRNLAEEFGAKALLTAIFPGDGDEITDDLKVLRRPHAPNLRPASVVASRERTTGRP